MARIEVDERSGVPIYVQVVEQIRRDVDVGSLRAGDRLPTVRALAEELSIAPNTIVKAYGELQRMGLVESRPGVGSVISARVREVSREQRVRAFDRRVEDLVRDAVALGVTQDDLWERIDAGFERELQSAGGQKR